MSCSDLMLSSFCTSRAAFVVYYISVLKICLLYKCTQNQLTVQVYTKPVDYTSAHKSRLVFKCTQNQFAKLVTNKWNVQGRNITNYISYLCLFLSLPASSFLSLPLPFSTCLCLSLPASAYKKMKFSFGVRHTHLTFALLELLLHSSK